MSAPDPKAWEATGAELWDISGAVAKEAREIIESVARRRALAELRELAVSLDEDERGTHDTQDGLTEAWREVCARIAEIEAEETSQPSASAQTATP